MGEDEAEQWRALAAEALQRYAALLLVQACGLLNGVPKPAQRAPGPGRVVRFTLHGKPLTVSWAATGLLTVEWGPDKVLSVRPILEDLESVRDPAVIRDLLGHIAEVERGSAGEPGGPLRMVIYPGARAQRSAAANGVVDVLYRIAPNAPAVAPVSPLELGSVSRVVRALRWATLARRMAGYPVTITVGEAEWNATRGLGWLAGDDERRSVSALRPPTAWELEATRQRLGTLSRTTDRSRGIGDNAEHIRALTAAIEAAAESVGQLTACAVCGKDGRRNDQHFTARDGDLFACTCSGCGTRWETRRCRVCGERYPVLAPLGRLSRGDREEEVDRLQGGDLLAIACWADSEVSQTICPSCGTCGRAGKVESCPRAGCGGRDFA